MCFGLNAFPNDEDLGIADSVGLNRGSREGTYCAEGTFSQFPVLSICRLADLNVRGTDVICQVQFCKPATCKGV